MAASFGRETFAAVQALAAAAVTMGLAALALGGRAPAFVALSSSSSPAGGVDHQRKADIDPVLFRSNHLGSLQGAVRRTASLGTSAALPSSSILATCALVGAAAGLAKRRSDSRRRSGTVVRQVTLEEVANATVKDLPFDWVSTVTPGMAQRYVLTKAISERLEKAYLVVIVNFMGLTHEEACQARDLFPPQCLSRVLKNSLVKKAMAGTEWEGLSDCIYGTNMYLFVETDDDVKPAIEALLKFEKEFRRDQRVAELNETLAKTGNFQLKSTVCGGMLRDEWTLLEKEDIVKFKNFQTRTELIGRIAGCIKQVPTKLAVCAKQLPQKLAIGTKKIVEKMEEAGKDKVADVVA